MLPLIQYIILWSIASVAIIVGLLGLILPILPGLLLISIGIVILSLLSSQVDAWLSKITVRHPKLHQMIENLRTFISRIIGKK